MVGLVFTVAIFKPPEPCRRFAHALPSPCGEHHEPQRTEVSHAVLRIYIGFYIFSQGLRKFHRNFPKGDWIGRQIGDLRTVDL
jgi:hypothetical protein